jgi:hypothetical protein
MSPRRRLASKARWSCMSAAYRSTMDRSCHPISRIKSPSDPPPASQSFATVCLLSALTVWCDSVWRLRLPIRAMEFCGDGARPCCVFLPSL